METAEHPENTDLSAQAVACVIDPDPGIRNSLRILLETLPVRVLTYSCAEDFLERSETEAVSIVITELDLPGMGGIELKMALDRCEGPIPVIGLTTPLDAEQRRLTSRLRFLAVLEKPFVHGPLLEWVQETVQPP